ncbi:MAG TPA: glutamate racemase [Spirochaetota bacterium]|nr:glutamate racemase [Spirochaetota bacterium]HPF05287.1 glutamate racemase [Spirochaetota bacterium]HPJ41025.1 glutamate racemase [Spirochaetota bacterium]HPR36311.1 glutamate racemase [Spirochaetota bacterium]HRX46750.1 glutamate racemase [Spirochaetota bacterium]
MTRPIAFFDSGIGGITVLHEALRLLPDEDYIYYADTLNAPYGTREKHEVKKLVSDAVDFIVQKEVKAVVIACNTATSAAVEDLRRTYSIPIIGMEPAVKPAVEKNGRAHKRVIVTATPLTLKEEKLRNLIDRVDNEHIVDLLPLPDLVKFAERYEFSGEDVYAYIQEEFSSYDLQQYGTVVLGCTHFIYFKKMLTDILPSHIDIIDGNKGTVNNLKKIIENRGEPGGGSGMINYFCSGEPVTESNELGKMSMLLKILSD